MQRKCKVVICDIDGTVALRGDRSPFDWKRVGEDTVNHPVVNLLKMIDAAGVHVVLFSGRDYECFPQTIGWLEAHNVPFQTLCMRPKGDTRRDSIVKRELFEMYIEDEYEVVFVLDDRDQVVKMWREELHLPCFQVAYGNF